MYFDLLGPVTRVLDIGCGGGDVRRYKPRPSIRVFGLDNDLERLKVAARFERALRWDGDCGHLPFADEMFDGIVAKDVLEHLQKPWCVVADMYRVLRPGGAAVVSVPMAKARAVWDDYTHIRGFTARALRVLFEDHGFVTERLLRMGGVPLAGRLKLVRYIPALLAIPPASCLLASSWMMVARRASSEYTRLGRLTSW